MGFRKGEDSLENGRSYAEEFVHAMNELAGNFTDDEELPAVKRAAGLRWL